MELRKSQLCELGPRKRVCTHFFFPNAFACTKTQCCSIIVQDYWINIFPLLVYSVCHFVLVFFSPFSIAITSLGEERANSAFNTFVRFVLVWICRFPLPLGVWKGLRLVIVALPGLFSYLFLFQSYKQTTVQPLQQIEFYLLAVIFTI